MDSGEVGGQELERRSQTLQEDRHSQHPHHNILTYSEAGMEFVRRVDGMPMVMMS